MPKKYKDPLHIPSSELVIWWKGKEHTLLNKALLDRQNCWGNLQLIKDLHHQRLVIENQMEALTTESSLEDVKRLTEEWTENQFALQKAWGFEENSTYHQFWEIPSCGCPKIDNRDAYPTGYYVKNGGCVLHGSRTWADHVGELGG